MFISPNKLYVANFSSLFLSEVIGTDYAFSKCVKRIFLSSFFIWLLIGLLLFPPPAWSVAVLPTLALHSLSEKNDERALREHLSDKQTFHLVDAHLQEDILAYHDHRFFLSPELLALQEKIDRAKSHYLQFENEEALEVLTQATDEGEKLFQINKRAGALLCDAYLTAAIIAHGEGNREGAALAFEKALAINPKVTLDSSFFPPSAVQLLENEKQKKGGSGSLDVVTDPAVAEISLNGTFQGVSPLTLSDLPAGDYALEIEANHYRTITKTISVHAEEKVRIDEKLQWTPEKEWKREENEKTARQQVNYGLFLADILKADRLVLLDTQTLPSGGGVISARMIDRHARAGFVPYQAPYDSPDESREQARARLAKAIADNIHIDLASHPELIDPSGAADPIVLAGRKRERRGAPILWGALGMATVGAVIGSLVAATSGGDSPSVGAVTVEFQ